MLKVNSWPRCFLKLPFNTLVSLRVQGSDISKFLTRILTTVFVMELASCIVQLHVYQDRG